MKSIYAAIVLLFAFSAPASAWHHVIAAPVAKAGAASPSRGSTSGGSLGGAACTGGCLLVGGFIAAVAGAIIIHEILGPACAKKGNKNGYDTPTFWRPYCKRTRDPKPIAVRG